MTKKHFIAIAYYLFYAPLYITLLAQLLVLRIVRYLLKTVNRRRRNK